MTDNLFETLMVLLRGPVESCAKALEVWPSLRTAKTSVEFSLDEMKFHLSVNGINCHDIIEFMIVGKAGRQNFGTICWSEDKAYDMVARATVHLAHQLSSIIRKTWRRYDGDDLSGFFDRIKKGGD